MKSAWIAAAAASFALVLPGVARASTGLCDSSAAAAQACIDAVTTSGGVVDDIFHDTAGNDAQNLPTYGVLFNQWPGCDFTTFAGCAGYDTGTADCPGQYACDPAKPNTFANASTNLAAVDHLWWHPCRSSTHTMDANNCPQITCVADGDASGYYPWEGLVFDLGGPSNKVAIFATNDHGPQPCESLEYTVYLTDNPFAHDLTDLVQQPTTDGVDPQKWNRAVLSKVFTHGWYDTRTTDPAGHAACGDTATYPVEQDSFVQEFSLPCGITFRYAAVIAGNDGLDFPACQFASSEAELDAVAGLTESGAGVCPDADGDHFVDCACLNAPPVCDCDDSDPAVHPGAPEACDATKDLNCDGHKGTACPDGDVCHGGLCLTTCSGGENPFCPTGYTCTAETEGHLCEPKDCGCQPGEVCVNDMCVDACLGVVCPGDQICQDGRCIDPCEGVVCAPPSTCDQGTCRPPCNCYAQNLGCPDPTTVCDANNTNQCVQPSCVGVTCTAPEACNPDTGMCAGFCNAGVQCPQGQRCDDTRGCIGNCDGVTCDAPKTCDPATGMCTGMATDPCAGVFCTPPAVCQMGMCVGGTTSGTQGSGQGGSGHTTGEGGTPFAGSGGGDGSADLSGGCCGVAGGEAPEGRGAAALALFALGLAVASRRRR